MAVKVIKCKCNSEFQDKEYGKGMRLHNTSPDEKNLRCTVCGNVVKK